MKRYLSHVLVLLLLAVVCEKAAAQQDAWMTKNIDEWNASDISTIMNNSAWVKTQEVRLLLQSTGNAALGSGANNVAQAAINTPIDFEFKLRLRSALPIRLALVRASQISANYEKLTKEERATLDAKLKGLFTCSACAEHYVLTLSSSSKTYPGVDAVFNFLKDAQLQDLKRYVYLLSSRGEKRDLVHFMPPRMPGEEAVFFFKRFDAQGKPLLTPNDKQLIFRLSGLGNNATTNFIIDVSKIIVQGQVIF
jgi:hypothetical protein